MDNSVAKFEAEPELSIREIMYAIVRRRWLALGFVVLLAVAGYVVDLFLPVKYTAQIVLSPVSSNSSGGRLATAASSLLSQFGGLASIAGLSAAGDTKREESLAVLQSEALTDRYIQQNNLLAVLFSNRWHIRGASLVLSANERPSLWKGNRYFKKKVRSVATDAKTGIVTLSITWTNPVVAAEWANGLVKMANDYLRTQAIDETQRNIAFLEMQVGKTESIEERQAIYTIMQNEINQEMLAKGNAEFAFRILDPAVAPEVPSTPKPWVVGLGALGVAIGLVLLIAFLSVAWTAK